MPAQAWINTPSIYLGRFFNYADDVLVAVTMAPITRNLFAPGRFAAQAGFKSRRISATCDGNGNGRRQTSKNVNYDHQRSRNITRQQAASGKATSGRHGRGELNDLPWSHDQNFVLNPFTVLEFGWYCEHRVVESYFCHFDSFLVQSTYETAHPSVEIRT